MNILSYFNSIRPAIPYSAERSSEIMSNSELRRLLLAKAIVINGQTDWTWDEEIPCYVWELVFFPKSVKPKGNRLPRRTTII